MQKPRAVVPMAALTFAFVAAAHAQTNTIPGLDGRLTNSTSPTYFGRRGPTHPNGEIGISYSYSMCNPGSVLIPWFGPGAAPNPMRADHPMFAYMVVRETNDRFEQITDTRTYVKHAFSSANSTSTCGGTCVHPGTSTAIGLNCTDTYSATTNANRTYLGPSHEIDPWTGIWNPVGSYFDQGDPAVAAPANQDGVRSLPNGNFSDLVKNRVTLREADLLQPGRLFYCMHLVILGEDGDNHLDNIGHRQLNATWSGTNWTLANGAVGFTAGTVLNRWSGASVSAARNGDDDGHFFVAVKVTGPVGGLWHYEYAVQNYDNARGGASLRIPVCPSTTVTNVTFGDIDADPLNEWSTQRIGAELMFGASANNPLDWNSIYNFGFDCDAPPASGNVAIDQARLGAGALTVQVASQVPGGTARVVPLGAGCGAPPPQLLATTLPVLGDPLFSLSLLHTPNTAEFVFTSLGTANVLLAPGCTQWLDGQTLVTHGMVVTDGLGAATIPLPLPNSLVFDGLELNWQVAGLSGGPVFGQLSLGNGLQLRLGCR